MAHETNAEAKEYVEVTIENCGYPDIAKGLKLWQDLDELDLLKGFHLVERRVQENQTWFEFKVWGVDEDTELNTSVVEEQEQQIYGMINEFFENLGIATSIYAEESLIAWRSNSLLDITIPS